MREEGDCTTQIIYLECFFFFLPKCTLKVLPQITIFISKYQDSASYTTYIKAQLSDMVLCTVCVCEREKISFVCWAKSIIVCASTTSIAESHHLIHATRRSLEKKKKKIREKIR